MSVEYPQNDFTAMIERTAAGNRSGQRAGGVPSAEPRPTAQSANLGREVPPPPPPMTAEEREELDRLAREAGIKDERLGNTDPEVAGAYGSLEEAIAAGRPVNAPAETDTPPQIVHQPSGMFTRHEMPSRQTAREFIGRQEVARFPDFHKVQGIDLIRGVVYVDAMDFPISPEDVTEFKRYVLEIARAAIMTKLEEAASLFALPEEAEGGSDQEGEDEEVQRLTEGSGEEPTS